MADSPVACNDGEAVSHREAVNWVTADHTTLAAPLLTVEHSGVAGEDESDIIEMMYWKLYDLKVFAYYHLPELISKAYAWTL